MLTATPWNLKPTLGQLTVPGVCLDLTHTWHGIILNVLKRFNVKIILILIT
jgi:hypothetical protein